MSRDLGLKRIEAVKSMKTVMSSASQIREALSAVSLAQQTTSVIATFHQSADSQFHRLALVQDHQPLIYSTITFHDESDDTSATMPQPQHRLSIQGMKTKR